MWQMHADIPLEDQTHETFWRRLLRWLVDGVPERLEVLGRSRARRARRPRAGDRDAARRPVHRRQRRGRARDGHRAGRAADRDAARVRGGSRRRVPRDVHRRAGRPLRHRRRGRSAGQRRRSGKRGPRRSCARRPTTASTSTPRCGRRSCARVAEDTGGRFYTPATASTLPEDITYLGRGVTVVQEKDLWDMPASCCCSSAWPAASGCCAADGGSHDGAPRRAPLAARAARRCARRPGGRRPAGAATCSSSSGWAATSRTPTGSTSGRSTLVDAARGRYGLPAESVDLPRRGSRRATRRASAAVRRAKASPPRWTRSAARARPGDRVFIVLIGHGASATGGRAVQPARART